MGVIAKMGEDTLKAVLDSGYHDRYIDQFPGIDNARFKELYENRDKSILKQAMVTPIAALIKNFTKVTLENINNSPFHYKPKVILNVHPYKLTESEIGVLITVLKSITLELADISVVDMAPSQITPLYVKTNLSAMVLYRYDLWLEEHCANELFTKVSCPDVTVFGPRIYFKKPDKAPNAHEDPFEAMQLLASPFVGLILLPVEQYSMVVKLQKKP